ISLQALNGLRVREAAGAGIGHLCPERGHRTLTIKLVRRATDQAGQRRNIITITAAGQAQLLRFDTRLAGVRRAARTTVTWRAPGAHRHAHPAAAPPCQPTPPPCRPARTPLTDRSQPTLCPHVAADLALI